MKDEDHLKHIQDAINKLPEEFSILEEQIDIELQMAYFDMARKQRNTTPDDTLLAQAKLDLYNPEISLEDKKELLVKLAGLDDVEAFRTIEAFHKQASNEIKSWSVLALQESRMVIQSSLLGEQQVFISTGLGGKGQNIRYFVAMSHNDSDCSFNETQRKLLESEFRFFLNESEGELEEIDFHGNIATAVFLFPLKQNLHTIFKSFIDECNQYGDFLSEDVIITNVKKLALDELQEFINKNRHDREQN
ncbi:hypothetical protein [Sunxiuqinia sp. sy24]|uniref:hypothetical protein n=1 Tax=Sunxiuqinia sp. sy24 TaxID=3461495 RepID=UPI0040465F8F